MNKYLLAIAFSLTMSFEALPAGAYNLAPADGGFSIQVPGKPTLSSEKHKSFVGSVTDNTYTYKGKGSTYSASYSVLPGVAVTLGGSGTIFGKARDGLLKDVGGKETSFTDTSQGGNDGKELLFEIPSAGSGPATMGKARFFLKDKILYVLVGMSPKTLSPAVNNFLNSFQLTGG